jgi:hypothetical protein
VAEASGVAKYEAKTTTRKAICREDKIGQIQGKTMKTDDRLVKTDEPDEDGRGERETEAGQSRP